MSADVSIHREDRSRMKGDVQCTATTRRGTRCERYPEPGAAVCILHGAGAVLTKIAAAKRLFALFEPAVETLFKALGTDCEFEKLGEHLICKVHGLECPSWKERVNAAKILLDRSGFGPRATLALEKADPSDLQTFDKAALVRELADLSAQLLAEPANTTTHDDDVHPSVATRSDDVEVLH